MLKQVTGQWPYNNQSANVISVGSGSGAFEENQGGRAESGNLGSLSSGCHARPCVFIGVAVVLQSS
jgi:hypothetical protein